MRYSIIGNNAQNAVSVLGGVNIISTKHIGIVYADLTQAQVDALRAQGYVVAPISTVTPDGVNPPVQILADPLYTPSAFAYAAGFEVFNTLFSPPMDGSGMIVGVLDSGIRGTHVRINGNILFSKNYTTDPAGDGFNHGTGVANVVRSVAPGCALLDLKVIGNDGTGTDENVVLAIDDCIDWITSNPNIAPIAINVSLGQPDDGSPYNTLRVACRRALYSGIWVVAAGGNSGPTPTTITAPACEDYVLAIGSIFYPGATVSSFSSRGPTREGLIKPDAVFLAENLSLASSVSDTAVIGKSGTSFAAPFYAGASALFFQAMERFVYSDPVLNERILTMFPGATTIPIQGVPRAVIMDPEYRIENWLPHITGKAAKDNDVGYGMMLGQLILDEFEEGLRGLYGETSTDLTGQMMGMAVVVGMMGMIMRTLPKL